MEALRSHAPASFSGFWRLKNAAHVSLGVSSAVNDEAVPEHSSGQGTTDDVESSSSEPEPMPRFPSARRATAAPPAQFDSGSYNLRRRAKEATGLLSLIDGISDEEDQARGDDGDDNPTRFCQGCKKSISSTAAESDFFICNNCMSKGVTRRGRFGVAFEQTASYRGDAVQAWARLQNDSQMDWSADTALLPLGWQKPLIAPISAFPPRESIQLSQADRLQFSLTQFPATDLPEELAALRKENAELSTRISDERLVRLRALAMARDAIDEADVLQRQTELMWDDIDLLKKRCDSLTRLNLDANEKLAAAEKAVATVKATTAPAQGLADKINVLNADSDAVERRFMELETELVLERQRAIALDVQLAELKDTNQKLNALQKSQLTNQQLQMMQQIPQQMQMMQQYMYPNAAMRFFPGAPQGMQPGAIKPADLYMMQLRAAQAAAAAASGQALWST